MKVIIQIQNVSELEEIAGWLSKKKIVIENAGQAKLDVSSFLKRLTKYRVQLPQDYRFNRDEANER